MSFDGMPNFFAVFIIFSAIATLSSAVSGMPLSSKVNPRMAQPYFFTIGKILSRDSFLALTEFIMGLPL